FVRPQKRRLRTVADSRALRPLMIGEAVRDWGAAPENLIWYPYDERLGDAGLPAELWSWRQLLAERRTFQGNMADAGLEWWDYMQYTASPYTTPLSIVFADIATHNHYILDRGGAI